jgi:hypothetical protein
MAKKKTPVNYAAQIQRELPGSKILEATDPKLRRRPLGVDAGAPDSDVISPAIDDMKIQMGVHAADAPKTDAATVEQSAISSTEVKVAETSTGERIPYGFDDKKKVIWRGG